MFLPVFNEKAQKGLTCGVIGNTSDFGSEPARTEHNSNYFLKQKSGTFGRARPNVPVFNIIFKMK